MNAGTYSHKFHSGVPVIFLLADATRMPYRHGSADAIGYPDAWSVSPST